MDRESYTLCYHNGKKHIELAKRLGDEKDYGTAITFFVLGLEELIKYLVIPGSLADDKLFTIKEINSLFSNHSEKHKIIIEFLESTKSEFAEKFIQSVFNNMTEQPLTDDLKNIQKNRFKQIGSILSTAENHLTDDEINVFIQWLDKNANTLKNKGLYVDREDKSTQLTKSKLVSPSDIRVEDFNLVLKFTESFLRQATFSKDLDLTDDEFIKMLNSDIRT